MDLGKKNTTSFFLYKCLGIFFCGILIFFSVLNQSLFFNQFDQNVLGKFRIAGQ